MALFKNPEKRKKLSSVIREQNEVLSFLDGYLTALDGIPDNITQTYNVADNPFKYLLLLLEHLGCSREEMIAWVAKFIKYALPVIELGVKGILLSNMQNLVACSVDPRIPAYARNEGMSFNLSEIDPLNILAKSPLDKYNQLYFGTKNITTPYGFVRPIDMNTFLWFVVHKGKYPNASQIDADTPFIDFLRSKYNANVVKGKNIYTISYLSYNASEKNQGMSLGSTFVQSFRTDNGIVQKCSLISLCTGVKFRIQSDNNQKLYTVTENVMMPIGNAWDRTNYYVNRPTYFNFLKYGSDKFDPENEQRDYDKDIPLCSFQYVEALKGDENISIKNVNSIYNCINVRVLPKPFVHIPHIGQTIFYPLVIRYNCDGKADKEGKLSVIVLEDALGHSCQTNVVTSIINKLTLKYDRQPTQAEIDQAYDEIKDKNNDSKSSFFSLDGAIWWYELAFASTPKTPSGYRLVIDTKGNYKITRDTFVKTQTYQFDEISEVSEQTVLALTQECYFGLTLYEFNYDYIMSQRLFDSKVVATQLINILTNFMIGASITLSQTEIEGIDRVYRIVEKMVEADDYEATDCFFKFSNAEYEQMSRDAEMKRARLIPFGNCERNVELNKDAVVEALNNFGDASELQESIDSFSRVVREVSATIDSVGTDPDIRYSASIDFITNIIQSLTVVIVTTLLSPKVMLMIMMNQKLCGSYNKESWNHISVDDVLYAMSAMISAIILEIRDLILKELLVEVQKRIAQLMLELQAGLVREQIEVYRRAIRLMLKACRFGRSGRYDLDTVLDEVNYADIDEVQRQNNETNKC